MRKTIKRIEQRGTLTGRTEAGREVPVEQYVEIIDARSGEHPNRELDGDVDFRTRDGRAVVDLGDRRFQIVETGEILTVEGKIEG